MNFLLLLPALAVSFLIVSGYASVTTTRRYMTERDVNATHHVAMTLALWAIAILLLWIGLR